MSRVENPVQCPRCKRVDWREMKSDERRKSGSRAGAVFAEDERDGVQVAGSLQAVGGVGVVQSSSSRKVTPGRVAQLAEHSARPAHAVGCKCGMCKILAGNRS